jgi:hypothetical protein
MGAAFQGKTDRELRSPVPNLTPSSELAGDPAFVGRFAFGAVGSGKETCILYLCQGAQGGRVRGANTTTFQQDGDEEGDKGLWMSVWVDDVDEMHKHCVAVGLEVTFPPTDMPWNVREMHLRHPDGHVFRVGRGFEPKK